MSAAITADWIETEGSRVAEAAPVKLPGEREFERALATYVRGYREQNLMRFAGRPSILGRIAQRLSDRWWSRQSAF